MVSRVQLIVAIESDFFPDKKHVFFCPEEGYLHEVDAPVQVVGQVKVVGSNNRRGVYRVQLKPGEAYLTAREVLSAVGL